MYKKYNNYVHLFTDMSAVGRTKMESGFSNSDGQQEIDQVKEATALVKRYDARTNQWITEDTKAKFIKNQVDLENQESKKKQENLTKKEEPRINETQDIEETQEMQDTQEL